MGHFFETSMTTEYALKPDSSSYVFTLMNQLKYTSTFPFEFPKTNKVTLECNSHHRVTKCM